MANRDPKEVTFRNEIYGYVVSTIRMPPGFTYAYETTVRRPDGSLDSRFVRGTNSERDALAAHTAAVAFVRGKIQ